MKEHGEEQRLAHVAGRLLAVPGLAQEFHPQALGQLPAGLECFDLLGCVGAHFAEGGPFEVGVDLHLLHEVMALELGGGDALLENGPPGPGG